MAGCSCCMAAQSRSAPVFTTSLPSNTMACTVAGGQGRQVASMLQTLELGSSTGTQPAGTPAVERAGTPTQPVKLPLFCETRTNVPAHHHCAAGQEVNELGEEGLAIVLSLQAVRVRGGTSQSAEKP